VGTYTRARFDYGLSRAAYDALVSSRDTCTICERRFKGREPYIDHCHKTGVVRGLLCSVCNTYIGVIGEREEVLLRAIAYLRTARWVSPPEPPGVCEECGDQFVAPDKFSAGETLERFCSNHCRQSASRRKSWEADPSRRQARKEYEREYAKSAKRRAAMAAYQQRPEVKARRKEAERRRYLARRTAERVEADSHPDHDAG
jgi:hypothetical protein